MDRILDASERRALLARKAFLPITAAVFVIILAGWGMSSIRPSIARKDIRTAVVDRGAVDATIDASGSVVPKTESVISSPMDTRLLRVVRKPGELLEPGDAIVELDLSSLELEVQRIEERHGQKKSEREQVAADSEEERFRLEGAAERAGLDVEESRYDLQQKRALFEDGLTSDTTVRQAETVLRKAEIESAQVEKSRESARRRADSRLRGLDLELATLARERDEARGRLALASARSDRRGVLTWVVRDEGASVRRGDALARVADLSAFRVEGSISEMHAASLRAGMPVIVTVGAHRLDGVIASVDPTIRQGIATFLVDLDEESSPQLRNNLRVEMQVITSHRDDALRIRRGPHFTDSIRQDVFVIRDGRARRTSVTFGLVGHDALEIVEGLEAGQEIVISDMKDFLSSSEIRIR